MRLPIRRPWWSAKATMTVSIRPASMSARNCSGGTCSLAATSLRRRVRGGDAAVDEQRLAGHERRLVRGEEQRAVGDLDGLAEAAHRDVHQPASALGVVVEELGQQ